MDAVGLVTHLPLVGKVLASGDHGGSNGRGLTYATPIDRVLTILKVNMVS